MRRLEALVVSLSISKQARWVKEVEQGVNSDNLALWVVQAI
jgi:hypothetical protein